MSNKKVFPNSDSFTPINRMTWQELKVKQLLESENISFESQKVFRIGKRRFIADFFLHSNIILECSSTSMYKYQVPLRKKAIHLQTKSIQLSSVFGYPVWVLLEATQPIGDRFYQTLKELMPSVSEILISCDELFELLFILSFQKNFSQQPSCFHSNSYSRQENVG